MGLFSDLGGALDPAGVFGGDHGDVIGNMLDPGGAVLENLGWAPEWMSDWRSDVSEYADSLGDFEMSQLADWEDKFKRDPTQLLIGAGDPFGAKLMGKVTGKEYDPYVNQYGGPTKESYQSAENKGIDTSNSRGSHAIAQLIASYYGTQGMGAGFGAAGEAAGIGAQAGQTIGGAAAGAGNAWANDGEIIQSAFQGALPGLSQMFGGAMNGVNQAADNSSTWKDIADTYGEYNKATGGMLGRVGTGVLRGAAGAAMKGDSVGEGAMQGGLTSGLGSLFGQGLNALGMQGQGGQNLGNTLASAGLGLYGAHQAKKDIQGQIGQLQQLFSPNSAYAQTLEQQLARKDAAAGRRSQYGPRSVELQARLAEMASRQAPQLNSLFNQKSAAQMSQYKDLYNVLRQSGLMEKLGTMGREYFQGYDHFNQGQFMGPPATLAGPVYDDYGDM